MSSFDVSRAAAVLVQTVLRHAEAVAAAAPEARKSAGPALIVALGDYGLAVINAGGEMPDEVEDFDGWLGENDGVAHPEPEPDLRQRIALFTRTDLAVADLDRLREVAARRLADCCGAIAGEAGASVRHPADAISHLVGHEPTNLDQGNAADFGLDVLSWTSATVADVTEADFDDNPWSPLKEVPVELQAPEQLP